MKQTRERGFWLNAFFLWELIKILLLVHSFYNLLLVTLLYSQAQQMIAQKFSATLSVQSLLLLVLFTIPEMICTYGLWNWKKWAAYGLLLLSFIHIVVAIVFPMHFPDWENWLIWFLIYGFLLRPSWPYLE